MKALTSFFSVVAVLLCVASGYVIKTYTEWSEPAAHGYVNIAVYVIIFLAFLLAATILFLIRKLGKLSGRGVEVWKSDRQRPVCRNCKAVLVDGSTFCHRCGTRIANAGNVCQHRPLGRKWFVYFTKVRPWLSLVGTLMLIASLYPLAASKLYDEFLAMSLSCFLAVIQTVLAFVVLYKSKRDYGKFLGFLRISLALDIILTVVDALLFDGVLYAVINLIVGALWYGWNMDYFTKRDPALKYCACNL